MTHLLRLRFCMLSSFYYFKSPFPSFATTCFFFTSTLDLQRGGDRDRSRGRDSNRSGEGRDRNHSSRWDSGKTFSPCGNTAAISTLSASAANDGCLLSFKFFYSTLSFFAFLFPPALF